MVRRMPYVQLWKGTYRFRRRVPDHLKSIIGKPEWVAALGTKDKAEANRLVVPHIGRTDRIISDAERGDYPPIADDRIEFDCLRLVVVVLLRKSKTTQCRGGSG